MSDKEKDNKMSKKMFIIISIVFILIIIFWLGYRVGKIGYKETIASQDDIFKYNTITLLENDMKTIKNNQLNIFNNEKFNNQKIIAPHSKGVYRFFIQNKTNNDLTYNIKFNDEMKHLVNMKYKLKMDNIYIKGSLNQYTTIDQLNLNDIIVLKNSTNIYTLEWYWEDDDEIDTNTGSQDGENYYKIKLEIEPNEYRN